MSLRFRAIQSLIVALALLASGAQAFGADPYRDFTLHVRPQGSFQVPMPGGPAQAFSYSLDFGAPLYPAPSTADFFVDPDLSTFYRKFWDRVLLKDGSVLQLGDTKVPLTCVFVDGQDNTKSGNTSPLLPDYVLKIYLVANDFSCVGPVNPNWPQAGGRPETWDTYLYFEIRDTTIMTPTEVKIRYRWNEYPAVFVDPGNGGH